MADESTHLKLPYIAANQAQKHVTHNEGVRLLDALVQMAVISRTLTVPPASPADGDRYIVAAGATGAWAGWDLNIAYYVDGAWMKLTPQPGWLAWIVAEAGHVRWDGTAWGGLSGGGSAAWGAITGTLASQTDLQSALNGKAAMSHTHTASQISDSTAAGRSMLTAADAAAETALLNAFTASLKGLAPASGGGTANFLRADGTWTNPADPASLQNLSLLGVNATADATNKLSVKSSAILFDNIGNGIQAKLNKNAAADTSSFLFQTGYSGRAEFGLTGDDDFHLKVSPNGSAWTEAFAISGTSGVLTIKATAVLAPQSADPASPANGQLWYNSTSNKFRGRQNGVSLNLTGGAWTPATLVLPSGAGACEGRLTVADASVSASSIISFRFANPADTDENDPEFFDVTGLHAVPGTGSFDIVLRFADPQAGPFNLQYQVN